MSNISAIDILIEASLFNLPEEGLTDEKRAEALTALETYVQDVRKNFLGYQANQALDYSRELSQYLDVQLNNIGDPFQEGNFRLNSKVIERAVLDYFAKLWNAPPRNPSVNSPIPLQDLEKAGDGYWGYVLSMGSTEGNLYALRNARDYLAGKVLSVDLSQGTSTRNSLLRQGRYTQGTDNAHTPVLFYSRETHYSIDKIKDILAIPTFSEIGEARFPGQSPVATADGKWPTKVPTLPTGSIDLDKLAELVDFFASRGFPIAINFNFGTTFKGALDDVSGAIAVLLPILAKYGLDERDLEVTLGDGTTVTSRRNGYWFHIDGALGASYAPFLEQARAQGIDVGEGNLPSFDFRNPVHSIVTSGHKEIGAPWPAGIYLTKQKYLLNFLDVTYIGAQDSTLSGSRNGFSALILWHYLARNSYQDQIDKIVRLIRTSESAYQKLLDLSVTLDRDLHVHRSPLSLSVLFLRPNPEIVARFSLSTDSEEGVDYAHLFAMEHVTEEVIDRLVDALSQPGAFTDSRNLQVPVLNPGTGFR